MNIDTLQNIGIIVLAVFCVYLFHQNKKLRESDTIRARLLYESGKLLFPLKDLTLSLVSRVEDLEDRIEQAELMLDIDP